MLMNNPTDSEPESEQTASWWRRECGLREVLFLALPLIISTASWALTNFVDRMLLLWYSTETMAAALPAGMLHFTMICFPIGVASYINTFVAQYHGADQPKKIGLVLVQGVKLCVLFIPLFLLSIPLANWMFSLSTSDPNLLGLETLYFTVLAYGAGGSVMAAALSSFFTGRGKTGIVMIVDSSSCLVNLGLDLVLIFGYFGFPEMGIEGAAWATVASQWFKVVAYGAIILMPHNRHHYGITDGNRWDWTMMRRLIRFGSPSGMQLFLEVAAFTIFLLMMGRLGTEAMAVTTLAFSINGFAFVPLIGLGIAISTLVGREIGSGNAEKAATATWSGCMIAMVYTGLMGVLYIVIPDIFLMAHKSGIEPAEFDSLRNTTVVLLRFVAAYCIFDALNLVFASALKGAGDVTFIMVVSCVVSIVLLSISWIGLNWLNFELFECWWLITAWIFTLGNTYLYRFLQGHWKQMKVIEPHLV